MTSKKIRKFNLKKEHLLLLALFFIFLFLRLFSDNAYIFANDDPGKYLGPAKNFPHHLLYNKELFLEQRPLYSFAIYFMSLLFNDYTAGILISLISAATTFFIVYKLVSLLSKNNYAAIGTLILFSLSSLFITYSTDIHKESFSVMLILASLYNYIRFLKFNDNYSMAYSSFFGIFAALASDDAIFLMPAMVVSYFFLRGKTKIWVAAIPLLLVALSFTSWWGVRAYAYMTHDYYPAAWDGSVVKTSNWGLRQLISSHYFEEIAIYIPFEIVLEPTRYIYPIAYMLDLEIAQWPNGLRFSNVGIMLSKEFILQAFIYTALFIFAGYALYQILKYTLTKKSLRGNWMLLILVLFFIFIIPIHQRNYSLRYTLIAMILLFTIINLGLYWLAKNYKFSKAYKQLIIVLIIGLLVYLPFYYYNNQNFLFSRKVIFQANQVAEFLNQLPEDGVTAQIGYTPELAYLTDKRVIALPVEPKSLFKIIDMYDISYVLYGESYFKPIAEATKKEEVINYDTIKYIQEHPQYFRLIKIIEEKYPWGKTDNFYVYKLIKG